MQKLLHAVLSSYISIKDSEDNYSESENKDKNITKKKPGRKLIIGGLPRDTFLSFSYTLRIYSALIKHLLLNKYFFYVLPSYVSNNRIERYFSFMRYLSGMHMALDIISFCQNAHTHLLQTISELCKNTDRSYSKLLCKSYFEEVKKLTNYHEKTEVDKIFINF